jgi:hypothetical protein
LHLGGFGGPLDRRAAQPGRPARQLDHDEGCGDVDAWRRERGRLDLAR